MLIDEVKKLIEQLSEKSASGGYLPDDEYSNYAALAQLKAIDQMSELLDYNQQIIVLASDVIKSQNVIVTSGLFQRPSDYYKYVSSTARYFENGKWDEEAAELIGVSERADRVKSEIVTPTFQFPVISETQSGFRFDPAEIGQGVLTYFVNPVTPVWAAQDGVFPPTFDPANSTDFVLSNKFKNYLVREISNMFSIEIKDVALQQATIQNMLTTS